MTNSKENIFDVLTRINKIGDPSRRAQQLVNLIPDLTTHGARSQALKIVSGIENSGACTFALSKLIPRLGDDQILEALKIASNISQLKSRSTAIAKLSSRLIYCSRQDALKIARELASDKKYRACADFLVAILPLVSSTQLQDVLEISYKIDDYEAREKRIQRLTDLKKSLEGCFNFDSDDFCSRYNSENPASYRAERNEEIDIEFCSAPRARAKILGLLYYYFEGEQQSQVFEKLLEAIEEIPAQPCKVRSLIALAPHLPPHLTRKVATRAYRIVKEIVEDIDKIPQKANEFSFRVQIHFQRIQQLESQLHLQDNSSLLSETLEVLRDAEEILFSSNSWWEPNMIEGVPPVPIPKIPKLFASEESVPIDQSDIERIEMNPLLNIGEMKSLLSDTPHSQQSSLLSRNVKKELVDCSVFSPPNVTLYDSFLVQVFVHLPEQIGTAKKQAEEADSDTKKHKTKTLGVEVARGSELSFCLSIPSIDVDEPEQRLIWRGEATSVEFGATVPSSLTQKTVIATVIVSQETIPLGHIKFKLSIVPQSSIATETELTGEIAHRYSKAFVSYSSKDRIEVLKRVQGLSVTGIEIFQDILALEPGDRWAKKLYRNIDDCDLFLLFWSTAAKESTWVLKEATYALNRQGSSKLSLPEIIPVIIEGPPVIPPPTELRHLHFNDKILYFLSVSE